MNPSDLTPYQKQNRKKLLLGVLTIVVTLALVLLYEVLIVKTPLDISVFDIGLISIAMALVIPIALRRSERRNNLRGVIAPDISINNVEKDLASDKSGLAIVPTDMLSKYDTEIVIYNWMLGSLSFTCFSGLILILSAGGQFDYLGYLTFTLSGILLVIIFKLRSQDVEEKSLAQSRSSEGLTLTAEGLYFNIALLEGGYREWLLANQRAIGFLKWNEIRLLSVQGVKFGGSHSQPPYYKFVLVTPHKIPWWKAKVEAVFILRRSFYSREQEIIKYIKTHADIPIEVYDELK